MGKKRTAVVEGTPSETKKKTIFRWEEAYTELSEKASTALKDARIKPDQLGSTSDGELLATPGITPALLEEIRLQYPVELADVMASVETVKVEEAPKQEEAKPAVANPRSRDPRHLYGRSAIYKTKKEKVEDRSYPLSEAIKLLKKISYSKHRTIELHLNVRETGIRGEVALPHSMGKKLRVAVYTPELGNDIKAGKIDFDILLATPADMAAIAPLARVLGPRGIMPNPKNGTVTDKPEERKTQLEKGATLSFKTEAKTPIVHLSVANLDQEDNQILENITATLTGIGLSKIKSTYLKSTMSPSIKLDTSSL